MKTKLLKKVRKRFRIFKYPNGVKYWDDVITDPALILYDCDEILHIVIINNHINNRSYNNISYAFTESEGLKRLQTRMLERILDEYDSYGKRRNAKFRVSEQIYFKK